MKLKMIAPKIYWIDFDSQYDLAMSFLRFQEHYESPEFKDKVFTLGQYREWYKTTQPHGKFSYASDWNGFNIPSYVFKPFIDGLFDPLTQEEKEMMLLLMQHVDIKTDFYLVGTHKGDIEILNHEICHALYHTNREYRGKINDEMHKYDLSAMHDILIRMGYHKDLCRDEAHAYICTGLEEDMSCPESLTKSMVDIKDQYFPDLV